MLSCRQCSQAFKISPEEQRQYAKFEVEPNGLCFVCDQKNRICFRNERRLYPRTCDATGQKIVSIYSPDKPYKVYKSEAWYADTWDATDYGRDFDFSRPFFEQFRELQLAVPRLALINVNNENSEYCNMTVGNKNCYLVFGGDYNQDVQYGTLNMHNISSLDLDYSNHNELCYFLGDSIECYGCQYAFDSKNCRECYYVSDCINCTECILCANLNNQSYCILNQQLSKEEYLAKKKELITSSYAQRQKSWQAFLELLKSRVVKFSHQINCENCTGDYLKNSRNCWNVFDISDCEDMTDVVFGANSKDCFRSSLIGERSELVYNSWGILGATNVRFGSFVIESSDIIFGESIFQSQNCFGCIGLRHKKHCILNKQYSKPEYEALVSRITEHMKKTGEWGQFFPPSLSCFGYNESTAQKYWPLKQQEALAQGFKWSDFPEPKPEYTRVIPADKLPDRIEEIPDDVLNWAIECEISKRLFKITLQELKFYRTQALPLPRLHPEERHALRGNLRNLKQLWDKKCAKCGQPVKTTYSPERPERVYCETCYLKEVY